MIEVTKLKNGQVFSFREVEYVCLMAFIDTRTSQVIVTALRMEDYKLGHASQVFGFRFFKLFEVKVIDTVAMSITSVQNNNEECRKYDRVSLDQESMIL